VTELQEELIRRQDKMDGEDYQLMKQRKFGHAA